MRKWWMAIVLTCVAALIWVPLWMLVSASLMGPDEVVRNIGPALSGAEGSASWPLLPQFPTLRGSVQLLMDSPEFFVMFWNSCKQTFSILIGQLLVGAPAAWAFARYKFPGKRWIFTLYIALMLMPFQVTMVSSYLILDQLKLLDTVWAIILPAAFSTFPVFIMYRFFAGIPYSLIEAAELDGAGPWQVFRYVGLPLGAPGILSAMVLGFLESWNALEQPLNFLENPANWPLSLYLPNLATSNAGVAMAASFIMLLPALPIFLFGQRHLEQGIRASGLKE